MSRHRLPLESSRSVAAQQYIQHLNTGLGAASFTANIALEYARGQSLRESDTTMERRFFNIREVKGPLYGLVCLAYDVPTNSKLRQPIVPDFNGVIENIATLTTAPPATGRVAAILALESVAREGRFAYIAEVTGAGQKTVERLVEGGALRVDVPFLHAPSGLAYGCASFHLPKTTY